MFSVLLIDDEQWILQGLTAGIDWAAEGFFLCGTAKNGIEGEAQIMALKPDFVLTDIRMPGQDGIALMEKIRPIMPQLLFAFLSGYAEFEYAQQGITLGACGYILKPIEEEDLLGLLRRVRKQLLEQQARYFVEDMESSTGYIRRLFPKGYSITVVLGKGEAPSPVRFHYALSPFSHVYITQNPLFSKNNPPPSWVKGAGVLFADPGGKTPLLSQQVDQARQLAHHCFITPSQRLYSPGDLPSPGFFQKQLTLLMETPKPQLPQQALVKAFQEKLPHIHFQDLSLLWFYLQYEESNYLPDPAETAEDLILRFATAENMLQLLYTWLEKNNDSSQSLPQTSVSQYINQHFAKRISLYDLSQAFSMSASTIRRLLNQEVNCSFQQYLNQCRMNHAQHLLKNTTKSIQAIAYACGFEDDLYFRKAFKKQFSLTPSDYRSQ